MFPTEQPRFFELVTARLAQYVKAPSPAELEAWWATCRPFGIHDVERAMNLHEGDEKTNKHAPRPFDVKARLAVSSSDSARCAATSPVGRCSYPGLFSDGTSGESAWYCPYHRMERSGPEAEKWIERSGEIPWEVARDRRNARMLVDSQRAVGVVTIAHEMAIRTGNRTPHKTPLHPPEHLRGGLGIEDAA